MSVLVMVWIISGIGGFASIKLVIPDETSKREVPLSYLVQFIDALCMMLNCNQLRGRSNRLRWESVGVLENAKKDRNFCHLEREREMGSIVRTRHDSENCWREKRRCRKNRMWEIYSFSLTMTLDERKRELIVRHRAKPKEQIDFSFMAHQRFPWNTRERDVCLFPPLIRAD